MSSGFISETELAEARKKRQDEWDKVRKADDPVEPPEEPYDPRSLYERLQEQKQRKELEFEEAHKLKNMIKGLDDDEIDYLEFVDRTKIALDKRRNLEDEKELDDYRNRVATLHEKSYDKILDAGKTKSKPKSSLMSKVSSQTKLLKSVVVTKNESTKRKLSDASEESKSPDNKNKIQRVDKDDDDDSKITVTTENERTKRKLSDASEESKSPVKNDKVKTVDNEVNLNANSSISNGQSGLICVGILPGFGYYDESSSDECSSNSDQESPIRNPIALDLLGRKIIKKDRES